jgi:predicted metal-binding membrane protein
MRVPMPGVLLRPKLAVAVALMLMIALAWALLAGGAQALSAALLGHGLPAVHGHLHTSPVLPRHRGAAHWFAALFMWLTMAVAMMLPTAAPAILAFAAAAADASGGARATLRQAGAFAAGYLVVWWSFGVVATTAQWLLSSLLPQMQPEAGMVSAMAGCLLAGAGLYQFSPLKGRCLAHCHDPLRSFHSHQRAAGTRAYPSGLRHGFHCLGCCWALMVLMLLGGAMNIGWTAALAGLMLAERVLPGGLHIGRVAGVGLIGWGGVLIAVA